MKYIYVMLQKQIITYLYSPLSKKLFFLLVIKLKYKTYSIPFLNSPQLKLDLNHQHYDDNSVFWPEGKTKCVGLRLKPSTSV